MISVQHFPSISYVLVVQSSFPTLTEHIMAYTSISIPTFASNTHIFRQHNDLRLAHSTKYHFCHSSTTITNCTLDASKQPQQKKEAERANWLVRLLEFTSPWGNNRHDKNVVDGEGGYDEDRDCDVKHDCSSFSRLLAQVSWSNTKFYSKLAFLCNMAHVIPEIKAVDLRIYHGLNFVTSSSEKKAEAAAIKAKLHNYSTCIPTAVSSVGESGRVYESTMTALVAAEENAKQEAARDLQSLHSSHFEWFICDDLSTYTRCFVIQGSNSLAAWQSNLLFEPMKFEGTEVLVHRGLYETAMGIYKQFVPEILNHLFAYGHRARLQFTGHSFGGSLSLVVNLMLVTRKIVEPFNLLPVVTFGSPFVFCGGQDILNDLGLDEHHVHSVIMHRDIVTRAFSCNYPNHVASCLKRISPFQSHPCLVHNRTLYSPMGKIFILQPDEMSSPPHPLLPPGCALYALEKSECGSLTGALTTFLNSPHPLETLSNPIAYGSEGTIVRDHDSSNYLKALNRVLRKNKKNVPKMSN